METTQPISIESFSYSWLVNIKPSLESLDNSLSAALDASDEASFIEMDPRMPPSKRFFKNSMDFKFDFPNSQSLVHADELFSDGYLLPFFVDSMKMEAYQAADFIPSSQPSSSHAQKDVLPTCPSKCASLRKGKGLSKRLFHKYLYFLRPWYRRLRGQKSNSRAENVAKRVRAVKDWDYMSEASPRISVAYSAENWRRSCDSESSIYEAVLHCKRSIDK
ncbi:putative Membrane-associated kinase regulator-like protein [Quillaja saponaria]|uniref:Membrane-associated kinase regulator-like protein n=1 Tax=Quillaja saponaria TaxID=32244 RepID=A0AAD7M526_QUISA|nr:putative Membrane-associated kinase regulator-like protein [Quillaja saponaria]